VEPRRPRARESALPGAGAPRPLLLRFLEVVEDRVTPTTLSKRTLTELCHLLEDRILAEDLAGTVIAGFQRARYFAPARARYEALTADPRRRAVVFTADDDDLGSGVAHVAVGDDHDLAREWFVLALTDAFSAMLFGRELVGTPEPDEPDRQFLTIWSFDPTVVGDLAEVVLASAADLPPDAYALVREAVEAVAPRPPEPLVVQRFLNALLERLQAGQVLRETDHRTQDTVTEALTADPDDVLHHERSAALRTVPARVAQRMDAPLATIATAAAAGATSTDPQERARLADVIEAEVLRTSQLAGELEELSRTGLPALAPVELVGWLTGAVEGFHAQGVAVDLAPLPDALTHGIDAGRLRLALSAVLADAGAAPGRTAAPRIALEIGRAGPRIEVSRDGAAPADAQPFAVQRAAAGRSAPDTEGVELTLAAALLASQGGALQVSCDGHLTTYRLQLPTGTEDAASTEHVDGLAALIIDDEPAIRGLVEALLRRAGWTVYAAATVEEAHQAAVAHHLDAVLLDLELAGEDGLQLLGALERLRPGTAERTILVSADPAAAEAAGGRAVVRKPFVWAELRVALDRVAGRAL